MSPSVEIGTTAIKAPISTDGVLLSSVISNLGVVLTTPPVSWEGFSLPNGLFVSFITGSGVEGDQSVQVDGTMEMPGDVNSFSGTFPVSYSSNGPVEFSATFDAVDLSQIFFSVNDLPDVSGSATAPWTATRVTPATPVFTSASILAKF